MLSLWLQSYSGVDSLIWAEIAECLARPRFFHCADSSDVIARDSRKQPASLLTFFFFQAEMSFLVTVFVCHGRGFFE